MQENNIKKRKLVPNALHWIAVPLFILGLASSISAYQSAENQYSYTHLALLPFFLGASPYLALVAIYAFSALWHFVAYVEFRVFGSIKNLLRK